MSGEGRVQQLLEQLLELKHTPEEVCAGDPELLPEVRVRWARIRQVSDQLDEMFPGTDSQPHPDRKDGANELPQVAGYKVESVLGHGGMGVVFKARQLKPSRPVALKMLLAGDYARPRDRVRFLREVEAAATLRHPNIAQIYEVGENEGRPYFTMELIEGGTLAQYLAQSLPGPRRAAELVGTLAATVQFAHKNGIIHRDLKPANILLTTPPVSNQPGVPKIVDFGLARFLDAGPELTHIGARLGTPSYMSPEQALGKTTEIGPAVDVYALGAILYESLTGRPPFEGQSAVETERRVISEDPTPPSRLDGKVPRDLETICLKCLHKSPARRYASAQDLADDLHRFLDGKPVLARPVGSFERLTKWARRRPAAALLLATLVVLLGAGAGAGAWYQQQLTDRRAALAQQQGQARDAIETALSRIERLRHQERWRDAKLILTEVASRLVDAASPDLEMRFRQAESDVHYAAEFDRVRGDIFYLPDGGIDYRQRATEYQRLFDTAGLKLGEDPKTLAEVIRNSAIRLQIVSALENWAYDEHKLKDGARTAQLLLLARAIDPDPHWRDQFRDLAVWNDFHRSRKLADTAFTTAPPPTEQQLAILGLLLREFHGGYRNSELLARAHQRDPGNFWLNREMGDACQSDFRWHEALGYYRAALALRPENAGVYLKIGSILFQLGQIDESLDAYRRAVAVSNNGYPRAELVRVLATAGYWKEAETECRKALESDPTNPLPHTNFAMILRWHRRDNEEFDLLSRAAAIGANDANARFAFAECLVKRNRPVEAVPHYRRAVELDPKRIFARHRLARALALSGHEDEALAEYQAIFATTQNASLVAVDCASLLHSQGRSKEALGVLRKAAESTPNIHTIWETLAAVLLDLGHFAEARTATVRAGWSEPELKAQIALCDSLIHVEKRLPAILAGEDQVTDAATARALAEWCTKHTRRMAASAKFYTTAFAADPALNGKADNRLRAARAAVRASCGFGDDAAALSPQQRVELRQQALDWLTAEYNACAERHDKPGSGNKTAAAQALRSWQVAQDLSPVREEKELVQLPPEERSPWQAIWAKVAQLVERDPAALIAQAQGYAGRREWKRAADCYEASFTLEPTDDSNVWFEYAACQLLSDDHTGYRRTCAHMLARCQVARMMRPYHAARACTLASNSTDDPHAPTDLSLTEIQTRMTEFWALTQFGALLVRQKNSLAAISSFDRSLLANGRPGKAVLNWLWLALAYQQSNNPNEARRWMDKATGWLDQQGGRMPRDTPEMGLHLHNWLEAHVLRREAEMHIPPLP